MAKRVFKRDIDKPSAVPPPRIQTTYRANASIALAWEEIGRAMVQGMAEGFIDTEWRGEPRRQIVGVNAFRENSITRIGVRFSDGYQVHIAYSDEELSTAISHYAAITGARVAQINEVEFLEYELRNRGVSFDVGGRTGPSPSPISARIRQENDDARARAWNTLKEYLDEKQLYQLETGDCFTVVGNITGKKYLIKKGSVLNIYTYDGESELNYCGAPSASLPTGDVMLAQMLLIQTDEIEFLRKANVRQNYIPDLPSRTRRMSYDEWRDMINRQ